jgi:RNA repair pathway DNA polymerase beta family
MHEQAVVRKNSSPPHESPSFDKHHVGTPCSHFQKGVDQPAEPELVLRKSRYYKMTIHKMKPDFAQYGFPYQENLIMAFIGDSHAHRTNPGMTDWYGLYIPPPAQVLGLESDESFVFPKGGEGGDDVHVCLYTLRQWASFAAKGNFFALYFLFEPLEFTSEIWNLVSSKPQIFLAKTHATSYFEFDDNVLTEVLWRAHSKKGRRVPKDVEFGYDREWSMNMIRLWGEAKELLDNGCITFPRSVNEESVAIGAGKYSLSEVTALFFQRQSEALAAQAKSPLPEAVDHEAINELLAEAYQSFWRTSPTRTGNSPQLPRLNPARPRRIE